MFTVKISGYNCYVTGYDNHGQVHVTNSVEATGISTRSIKRAMAVALRELAKQTQEAERGISAWNERGWEFSCTVNGAEFFNVARSSWAFGVCREFRPHYDLIITEKQRYQERKDDRDWERAHKEQELDLRIQKLRWNEN